MFFSSLIPQHYYNLKLADLLFLQESKSLDNNKLPNACICQEIHLP